MIQGTVTFGPDGGPKEPFSGRDIAVVVFLGSQLKT